MDPSIEPDERLTAFGNLLIDVHLWLRGELDRLREDVDAHLDGRGGRPRDLRAHCLTFCSVVRRHHTAEDGGAFPVLAERFPDLRPVLAQLERDHHLVDELLHKLEELLGGLGPDRDPAAARRVRGELDGLVALLESHFRYDERRLVGALNSLSAPGPDGTRPGALPAVADAVTRWDR